LAIDGANNLYVSDTWTRSIRKITPDGTVAILAGGPDKVGPQDGPVANVAVGAVGAIAATSDGTLYFFSLTGDEGGAFYGLRKLSGGMVSTVPVRVPGNQLALVATSLAGDVYVGASGDGSVVSGDSASYIQKLNAAGVPTLIAGSKSAIGAVDGVGSAARFGGMASMSVDGSGNIYVADTSNRAVRKISAGGVVSTVVGQLGKPLQPLVAESALPGVLRSPYAVAVTSSGGLTIVDSICAFDGTLAFTVGFDGCDGQAVFRTK
jgi:hypothetical protein